MGNKSKRRFLLLLGIIFTEALLKSKVGRKVVGSYKEYEKREIDNLRCSIKSKNDKSVDKTKLNKDV